MAFEFVDDTAAASTTVTKPTGVVDGDLIIVAASRTANGGSTLGNGFSQLLMDDSPPSVGGSLTVFTKIADGEGATWTLTNAHANVCLAIRGAIAPTTSQQVSNTNGTGTTPNLTTTTTDAWLLAAFYARGLSGGSAIATPSGYTARGEQTFTHTGLTARMALKLKETATAPGTYSADTTNNNSCINALIEIPLLVVSGRTSDFFAFF